MSGALSWMKVAIVVNIFLEVFEVMVDCSMGDLGKGGDEMSRHRCHGEDVGLGDRFPDE